MSVISVEKNPEQLTLTLIAEFQASVSGVWRMWDDPRLLDGQFGRAGVLASAPGVLGLVVVEGSRRVDLDGRQRFAVEHRHGQFAAFDQPFAQHERIVA